MGKKVGWYVHATNESGKTEQVSGVFGTKRGAQAYLEIWQKKYPDSKPFVEQYATTAEFDF